MATRHHILAVRKREDEEFRRLTESAEAEEEVDILFSYNRTPIGTVNF